jgi:hypothetical protein
VIELDPDIESICGLHRDPGPWCAACALAAEATRKQLDAIIAEEGPGAATTRARFQARVLRGLERRRKASAAA